MANSGEVKLSGVTKQFGSLKAIDEIDLTIDGGTYCCLLGPSGCGKTTILRMIAGHEPPTSGAIMIGGDSCTSAKVWSSARVLPWKVRNNNRNM